MDSIEVNNTTLIKPLDIAQAFNDYLIDANSVVHNTPNETIMRELVAKLRRVSSSVFVQPCSEDEIIKNIKSLNFTTSVGFDHVETKILKASAQVIAPILCYPLNLSFTQGIFPDRLKKSIVKPIFKKGNKLDLHNYRPITLVSIFSKIFEKAFLNRINIF